MTSAYKNGGRNSGRLRETTRNSVFLTSMAQQSLFNFFPKPAKRSKSSNEADRLPCTETDELIEYVEIQQVIFKPSYLQL